MNLYERAKTNSLSKEGIEFFQANKMTVPLCCIEIFLESDSSKRLIKRFKCTRLKNALPFEEFKVFCLQCQKEIESYLEKR